MSRRILTNGSVGVRSHLKSDYGYKWVDSYVAVQTVVKVQQSNWTSDWQAVDGTLTAHSSPDRPWLAPHSHAPIRLRLFGPKIIWTHRQHRHRPSLPCCHQVCQRILVLNICAWENCSSTFSLPSSYSWSIKLYFLQQTSLADSSWSEETSTAFACPHSIVHGTRLLIISSSISSVNEQTGIRLKVRGELSNKDWQVL